MTNRPEESHDYVLYDNQAKAGWRTLSFRQGDLAQIVGLLGHVVLG